MKTAQTKLGLGIVLSVILGGSAWAGETLVLYDNFNNSSGLIDPDKWFGAIVAATSPNQIREGERLISQQHLQLLSRGYSNTDTDQGESISGESLRFINPDSVMAIKATVQVLKYQLQGCGNNDTTSRVRTRLVGHFFNTTDNPTPGSALNDVFASIGLQRKAGVIDGPNTLRVSASIIRCGDATCYSFENLGSADLGTASLGQWVTLRLEWDKIHHQFIVQRDKRPEVLILYTVPDNSLPGAKNKRLEVAQSIANCTTVKPRATGFMSAFFDDVYVNPLLLLNTNP